MLPRLAFSLVLILVLVTSSSVGQQKTETKSKERNVNPASAKETFLQYCASCHGKTAKGDGPAAFVMKPPPSDLTTLAKRHEGKYPAGSVSAILTFSRSFAAHGASDMPVWGTRFKKVDPVHDPTGQQHIDDLVAYIESLQVK